MDNTLYIQPNDIKSLFVAKKQVRGYIYTHTLQTKFLGLKIGKPTTCYSTAKELLPCYHYEHYNSPLDAAIDYSTYFESFRLTIDNKRLYLDGNTIYSKPMVILVTVRGKILQVFDTDKDMENFINTLQVKDLKPIDYSHYIEN